MNLLITGATGLIGQNLLFNLKDWEGTIYCVCDKGFIPANHNVVCVPGDLSDRLFVSGLPRDVDCIIHLAQSSRYQEFPEQVSHVFDVNLSSTVALLDFGREIGISNFIYASSGGVYDNDSSRISMESDQLKSFPALGFYISTKLCSEIFVNQYSEFFDTQILRFFFVYGPNQNRRMLVPRLVESVLTKKEISIVGEKGIRINPIFADDAAKALKKAIGNKFSSMVNIAGRENVYLGDLVGTIGEILGRQPVIKHIDGNPAQLIGNIEKMITELHSPEVSLLEGLRLSMGDVKNY